MTKVYTAPPTIGRFMLDDSFIRGLLGPVGSGKSSGCVVEIMRRARMQQPLRKGGRRRSRWAVVRNSYRELSDTTIKTFFEWMPPNGTTRKWHSTHSTYTITDDDLDCEILFRALDRPEDVKKLLSLELTGAWINEAREMPLAILDMLQIRVGRYPPTHEEGATWSGIFMDTNPPDEDHWWYRLFEEDKPLGWKLFKQPSGIGPDAENLDGLPADYYSRAMAGKSLEWIKVYVEGQYGFIGDGKRVYPEWNDEVHQVEGPLPIIPGGHVHVGIDASGLEPAAVFLQKDAFGRWFCLRELLGEGIGALRFAEVARSFLTDNFGDSLHTAWPDPAGNARSPTDETTWVDALRGAGFNIGYVPSNIFSLRRESVGGVLQRLVDGKPGFILDSASCPQLRKGFNGGYVFKRVKVSGDERYRDEPNKNRFSHPHDALQYALLGAGENPISLSQARTTASRGKASKLQELLRSQNTGVAW